MKKLFNEFPETVIGYSDHSAGRDSIIYSYIIGANIIEKHFTQFLEEKPNKNDHVHSLNKNEAYKFISAIEIFNENFIGNELREEEKTFVKNGRRGLYASKDLKKDSKVFEEDSIELRPSLGNKKEMILPNILMKDIKKGEPLLSDNACILW
jgi:sialic acid synthase SpsE